MPWLWLMRGGPRVSLRIGLRAEDGARASLPIGSPSSLTIKDAVAFAGTHKDLVWCNLREASDRAGERLERVGFFAVECIEDAGEVGWSDFLADDARDHSTTFQVACPSPAPIEDSVIRVRLDRLGFESLLHGCVLDPAGPPIRFGPF